MAPLDQVFCMNAGSNRRWQRFALGLLLIVNIISVLGGGWWVYRRFRKHEALETRSQTAKTHALPAERSDEVPRIPSGEPFILDLDEPQLRQHKEESARLFDLPLQPPSTAGAASESYRLTDDDFVPKAIRAGFLLAPTSPTRN